MNKYPLINSIPKCFYVLIEKYAKLSLVPFYSLSCFKMLGMWNLVCRIINNLVRNFQTSSKLFISTICDKVYSLRTLFQTKSEKINWSFTLDIKYFLKLRTIQIIIIFEINQQSLLCPNKELQLTQMQIRFFCR